MSSRSKTESSNLGELQKVYRVKFGCGEIVIFGIIVLPLALFTGGMFATGEFIALIIIVPLMALLFGMIRLYLQERDDELSVYQNGFTYKSRNGLQTCLWKEIQSISTGRWKATIESVRKKNGELINFAGAMQGLSELAADWRDKLAK